MRKTRHITKRLVKAEAAAAIIHVQARNGWSNEETGEAFGCCGNTIRNRTDVDDHGKQVTIYELLRSIQSDGPTLVNRLLAMVGWTAHPLPEVTSCTDWHGAMGALSKEAGEVVAALCKALGDPDSPGVVTAKNIADHEIERECDEAIEKLVAIKALARAVSA